MSDAITLCRRRRTLPRTLACAGMARSWAAGCVRDWGVTTVNLDDLILDASELVTNAALHARGGTINVYLTLYPNQLRFAAVDQDPRPLRLPIGDPGDVPIGESGRGLLIVRATASQLGCRQYQGRKSVWALWEFDARIQTGAAR